MSMTTCRAQNGSGSAARHQTFMPSSLAATGQVTGPGPPEQATLRKWRDPAVPAPREEPGEWIVMAADACPRGCQARLAARRSCPARVAQLGGAGPCAQDQDGRVRAGRQAFRDMAADLCREARRRCQRSRISSPIRGRHRCFRVPPERSGRTLCRRCRATPGARQRSGAGRRRCVRVPGTRSSRSGRPRPPAEAAPQSPQVDGRG
jgi:hypothetical protein